MNPYKGVVEHRIYRWEFKTCTTYVVAGKKRRRSFANLVDARHWRDHQDDTPPRDQVGRRPVQLTFHPNFLKQLDAKRNGIPRGIFIEQLLNEKI